MLSIEITSFSIKSYRQQSNIFCIFNSFADFPHKYKIKIQNNLFNITIALYKYLKATLFLKG